jgi:hypothetical protein
MRNANELYAGPPGDEQHCIIISHLKIKREFN